MSKSNIWIISPSGQLRPGYYWRRLAKGAPKIPISFLAFEDRDAAGDLQSDVTYELTIDGKIVPWASAGPLTGEPIDKAEFEYLTRTRAHDRAYVPALAEARVAIDPLTAPLPF